MNNLRIGLLILVTFLLTSCKKEQTQKENAINGLWVVKKVKMGNQEMTPIARWMKFNADSTQTSGNGWLQHSVGSWSYKIDSKLLKVENFNGVVDDFNDPFKVDFSDKNMIWKRKEGDFDVTITLEKINKIPTSEANKLYGLWKFESIFENGKEISVSLNPSKKAMLFLRWDNTYELRNYPVGELYGIFKTHAHRLQIDMVSYSKIPKYQFYEFKLEGNNLLLNSTISDKQIKLTRINQFLK